MTTTVKITTHSWPVSVVVLDECADGSIAATTMMPVPPNSERMDYVHSTRRLLITEMKLPKESA